MKKTRNLEAKVKLVIPDFVERKTFLRFFFSPSFILFFWKMLSLLSSDLCSDLLNRTKSLKGNEMGWKMAMKIKMERQNTLKSRRSCSLITFLLLAEYQMKFSVAIKSSILLCGWKKVVAWYRFMLMNNVFGEVC